MHIMVTQMGDTALMLASKYGKLFVVQYLVEQRVAINTQSKVGNLNVLNVYLT